MTASGAGRRTFCDLSEAWRSISFYPQVPRTVLEADPVLGRATSHKTARTRFVNFPTSARGR